MMKRSIEATREARRLAQRDLRINEPERYKAYQDRYKAKYPKARVEQTQRWRERNRQQARNANNARKERYRNKLNEQKALRGCMNPQCSWTGEWTAEMLDFHHKDVTTKCAEVASLLGMRGRLNAEIAKCILLCANCHRQFHKGMFSVEDIPVCDFIVI